MRCGMKDIELYIAEKYKNDDYVEIQHGIYKKVDVYVTSLSFIQEPERGEGDYADNISQYPLDDILEKYYVYVSDFYKILNQKKSRRCYVEFASNDIDDIVAVKKIVGKHVYNKDVEQNGKMYTKLIIE